MLGRKFRLKAIKGKQRLLDALNAIPIVKRTKAKFHSRPQAKEYPARPATPEVMTGMRVTVTARFELPVDKTHYHIYEVSPAFVTNNAVFNGLVNHIEHCSRELITRQDIHAQEPFLTAPPYVKQGRFHLIFRIHREGRFWKELLFTSFQEQPLNTESAGEVVLETDRMIALYMSQHDDQFEWVQPAILEEDRFKHTTAKPTIGSPQNLCCIPSYGGSPGYTIELALNTQCLGKTRVWSKNIQSSQSTPLTLCYGENLMSKVAATLRNAVSDQEAVFQKRHASCNGLEGTSYCNHFEKEAFDVMVKIRNNLGPDHFHFSTRLKSFRILFADHEIDEYSLFTKGLETKIDEARLEIDQAILALDDLTITIHELRNNEWTIESPMTLYLNSSIYKDRKKIEAILQRIQTGARHVLRGHRVQAVITAHKRGHLVLDTVIQSGPFAKHEKPERFDSLPHMQEELQKRLQGQIKDDISIVCKDTISLDRISVVPEVRVITSKDIQEQDTFIVSADVQGVDLEHLRPNNNVDQTESTTPSGTPVANFAKIEPINSPKLRSSTKSVDVVTATGGFNPPPYTPKKPIFSWNRTSISQHGFQRDLNVEHGATLLRDYAYLADTISEKSDSPCPAPSLSDIDSVNSQEGPATPTFVQPSHFSGCLRNGLGIMDLNVSEQFNASQEPTSFVKEPTVIHHTSHLGEAAQQLLANIGHSTSYNGSSAHDTQSEAQDASQHKSSDDEDSLIVALIGPDWRERTDLGEIKTWKQIQKEMGIVSQTTPRRACKPVVKNNHHQGGASVSLASAHWTRYKEHDEDLTSTASWESEEPAYSDHTAGETSNAYHTYEAPVHAYYKDGQHSNASYKGKGKQLTRYIPLAQPNERKYYTTKGTFPGAHIKCNTHIPIPIFARPAKAQIPPANTPAHAQGGTNKCQSSASLISSRAKKNSPSPLPVVDDDFDWDRDTF